jgi:uncharacterized LabA/DUF88 family protein
LRGDARVSLIASEVVRWLRSLRTYWYDGAFDPTDRRYRSQRTYFDAVAATPGVQIRLGHVQERTPCWQHSVKKAIEACGVDLAEFERHYTFRPEQYQKGVDSLIVLEMVRLADRGVFDVAVLVAGDRDLARAVREAQEAGACVIVAHPDRAGAATELRQLADTLVAIDGDQLSRMIVEDANTA